MKLAALTMVMAMLTACGQKGALYLPKEQQKAKSEQTENKQSEQQQKDKEQQH